MVGTGQLTMGHARALVSAHGPRGARRGDRPPRPVGARGREARPGRQGAKAPRQPPIEYKGAGADIAALERQLGDLLGLKVAIKHSPKGGQVVLGYSSLDQLDMICQRLSGEKF